MSQKTQNIVFYCCMLMAIAGAAWIVHVIYQQSPNIDYEKSYSVEEVQKLVDEKVKDVSCGVINNEIICIYKYHKTSRQPVFCTVKWNGK